MKQRWQKWAGAILLWSVLGLLFALPNLSSGHWVRALSGSLAQWWSWGLIAPLIFWTDARLPFSENQLGMRILAHLPVSIAVTILYFYVLVTVGALLGAGQWSVLTDIHFLPRAFRQGFLWSWLVYWVIFGVHQTFRYNRQYLASELRLERMERSLFAGAPECPPHAAGSTLPVQCPEHHLFADRAGSEAGAQYDRAPWRSASPVAGCAGQAGDSAGRGARISPALHRDPEDSIRGESAYRDPGGSRGEVRAGAVSHPAAAGGERHSPRHLAARLRRHGRGECAARPGSAGDPHRG